MGGFSSPQFRGFPRAGPPSPRSSLHPKFTCPLAPAAEEERRGRQGKLHWLGRKGRFISVYPEIPASLLLIQPSPAGCRLRICTEPVLHGAIHQTQPRRGRRGAWCPGGLGVCRGRGVPLVLAPTAHTPRASSVLCCLRLSLARSLSPAGSGPRRAIIFLSWTR